MSQPLTTEDARQSLRDHVAAKGGEIRTKYGPRIGWRQLRQMLEDRACVRYPCDVAFDAAPLLPGELAHPVAKGQRPEDGFTVHVHPYFRLQPDRVPGLVLYQLVLVNYGECVSPADAETFGASALGLSRDEYYHALCAAADELSGQAAAPPGGLREACHRFQV